MSSEKQIIRLSERKKINARKEDRESIEKYKCRYTEGRK
jgi:hypothetical protein